jgi:mannose-6-phosphate isomerase-like protein (cupin superfamily)
MRRQEEIMNVINPRSCPPFITKDTSEIREFINPRLTPDCHNLSLAEATLYPGKSTQAHRHPQSEEIYYFLRGSGRLRIGAEEAAVAAGALVFIPAGSVHECWNTGSEPLVFLCHCAPAYAHDDTELV